MLGSKLLSISVYVSESCFGKRFEIVCQMNQVAVLTIDSNVILIIFIFSDVGETLLEVEGISHQVEKQGQEEVTPVLLETLPSSIFTLVHTVTPSIALGNDFRSSTTNQVSSI